MTVTVPPWMTKLLLTDIAVSRTGGPSSWPATAAIGAYGPYVPPWPTAIGGAVSPAGYGSITLHVLERVAVVRPRPERVGDACSAGEPMNVLSTDLPSVMSRAWTSVEALAPAALNALSPASFPTSVALFGKVADCAGVTVGPASRVAEDCRSTGWAGSDAGTGAAEIGASAVAVEVEVEVAVDVAARAAATTAAGGRMPAPAVRKTMSDTARRASAGWACLGRSGPARVAMASRMSGGSQRARPEGLSVHSATFRSPAAPVPGAKVPRTECWERSLAAFWVSRFGPASVRRGWALPGSNPALRRGLRPARHPQGPLPLGSIPSRYPRIMRPSRATFDAVAGTRAVAPRHGHVMTTVQAAVLRTGGQPTTVETLELAEPRAGEVRVRMLASGVCHSDLHVRDGEWERPTPIVMGHEGAGVVEAVGPGVTSPRVGELVALSWLIPCGVCRSCRRGRIWECPDSPSYRHTLFDGATVPRRPIGGEASAPTAPSRRWPRRRSCRLRRPSRSPTASTPARRHSSVAA